jgi:hypothetical protein
LRDAVTTLVSVVNPLSSVADRIPLPRRQARWSTPRTVPSTQIIDHEE